MPLNLLIFILINIRPSIKTYKGQLTFKVFGILLLFIPQLSVSLNSINNPTGPIGRRAKEHERVEIMTILYTDLLLYDALPVGTQNQCIEVALFLINM